MVVRIVGTNAELAADILREGGEGIETASTPGRRGGARRRAGRPTVSSAA